MENFVIVESNKPDKKFIALYLSPNGKLKKIYFGANGYDDFTLTGNIKQKQLYISRHQKREDWNDIHTAGFFSRYILWNESTIDKFEELETEKKNIITEAKKYQ